MELQKVEAERAARRKKATQFGNDASSVEPNLAQPERTDEHVASELGLSTAQWKKLKTVFQKAQSGDAEAKERT